jgi:hypothetical protein
MYKARPSRVRRLALDLICLAVLGGGTACGASPDEGGKVPDDSLRDDDEPGPDGDMANLGECDASGVFAVRMVTYAQFIIESSTSTWFYLEISQDGDQLEVVDSVDCGYGSVGGGMRAYTSTGAEPAFAEHNSQAGRKGVMKKSGELCDFRLDRFWTVHGVAEATYLPDGPFATYDLEEIKQRAPMPSMSNPEGVEDWDQDGHPGVTCFIGSDAARYAAGRNWSEYFSCNGTEADSPICAEEDVEKYTLRASTSHDMFTVRADFVGEDVPLGATSSLYAGTSMPLRIADNRVTFKRLGKSRDDGMAKEFWAKATPSERCAMLREVLPIEEE